MSTDTLVTGAAGFIGHHRVSYLRGEDAYDRAVEGVAIDRTARVEE